MDARNRDTGEVPAFEVGGWAFTSRDLEPSEFTAISDVWDIETEDGPVLLIDEEIPVSMIPSPLPFEGVDLGHTVFLAISDGVVMGVHHSEVQAAVHGDEVQEWEVR